MSNDTKQKRRRRRRGGVPTALVILLMVLAVAAGGLGGFMIARKTAPVDSRLEQANERIIELENTLSLIGFPLDGDPENWVFDSSSRPNSADDLAGVPADDGTGSSELWGEEDGILTGEVMDDSDPVVVAEFDGGQLLSTEVIPVYNDQLAAQVFAGYNADDVADSVLKTVLTTLAGEKVIARKAAELGLDKITDEDQARLEGEADRLYREQVTYYTALVTAEPGMTQAQLEAKAEEYMRESMGITRQTILEGLKKALPLEKYREYVVKDVTVSDAEVKAHYDERLAEQRANYTEYPEEYEYDHIDGATLLYNPEGYRRVRNLLLAFDSEASADEAASLLEQIAALDPEKDAEQIRALEEKLAPLYKPLETRAAEIQEKLKNGESFVSLMDQYGADPVMQSEPMRTEGYYVGENTYLFSTEFVQGAMILDRPGQVSTTLRSASGLHLAEYTGDVAPGDVPLESVYDTMKAEALQIHQDAFYEEQTANLLEQANVRYYPERLQ